MHIINQAWRNQSASLVQLFISERCQEVKGNWRATFQPLKSLTHSLKKLVEIGWSWTWGGMAQVWFVQMSLLSSSSSSPAFAHIFHSSSLPLIVNVFLLYGAHVRNLNLSLTTVSLPAVCAETAGVSVSKYGLQLLKFHWRRRTTAAIAWAHGYTHIW